jgi:MFS family permease
MAGQTADRLGRKYTIQIGSIIAIVGCALQTAAVNEAMLIVGRLIAGWSIGVLSMIVPVYQVSDSPGFRNSKLTKVVHQAEISPPHARGLLSGWTQMMISLGFFVANWWVTPSSRGLQS